MQTKQLFAAALLAVAGATSAMAGAVGDYASPGVKAVSTRSRDAVIAEVQNLRAQGQLAVTGELSGAPETVVVNDKAPLSREAVRAEVRTARAAGALPRNGELM